MPVDLEVRTTISPTPAFFRRVHYLAASLREMEGRIGSWLLTVSVGGGTAGDDYARSEAWSRAYPIEWRAVDPDAYAALGYRATNHDRAARPPSGKNVMLVDADVIFCKPFGKLLASLEGAPAICGVMAHNSPLTARVLAEHDITPSEFWQQVARSFGIDALPLEHHYSNWRLRPGVTDQERAPAYLNGGMILGPADMMAEMLSLFPAAEDASDSVLVSYFRPQIARTLAIYRAGLPVHLLPLRYNFPNDPDFDNAYPEELEQTAVLHYLRRKTVHRDDDFATPRAVRRLIQRTDLTGSNELLRRRIDALHDTVAGLEARAQTGLRGWSARLEHRLASRWP